MNYIKQHISIVVSLFSIFLYNPQLYAKQQPRTRLAIIMIVDQCAYRFIHKLQRYFTGGLHHLINNGVVYQNAHHPHAVPATATGFTAFSTGVFAKDHGIIGNSWFTKDGKEVLADEDNAKSAAVFSKTGVYPYGRSAKNTMVDGFSDQCILDSQPHTIHHVFGLALKSRSATALASKLGKAIWFDLTAGQFTSSKAYFDKLPDWLVAFNTELGVNRLETVIWNPLFSLSHPAYQLKDAKNYRHSQYPEGFIGREFPIGPQHKKKDPYDVWFKLPAANKGLLDLATVCIKEYLPKTSGTLLIWLGLNALDLIGHAQGPDSLETTDLLLQLDKQLQDFFSKMKQLLPEEEILYMLSADHGVDPIPELMKLRGIPAERIEETVFVATINRAIEKIYNMRNVVARFHALQLYLNEKSIAALSIFQKNALIQDIVTIVKSQPGVKTAWSYQELINSCYLPSEFGSWYKNQLYPGRSGDIIIQPLPYYQFTDKKSGTLHEAPYNVTTHVPLMIYQKGRFKPCTVFQNVWSLQVPNTLSYLLNIPRPSSSTCELLPGLLPGCISCLDR